MDIQPYETELLHEDYGLLTQDALRLLRPLYDQAIKGTEILFQQAEMTGRIDHEFVKKTFRPITNCLKQQHDVVDLLLELNVKDDYTYQHSLQVGMLSYYIARWNEDTEEEALVAKHTQYGYEMLTNSNYPNTITLEAVPTYFTSHMLPNFIGKKIKLDTEEIGKIIMIKNNDFFCPLIQIEDHFVNLAEERQLKIKQVIH